MPNAPFLAPERDAAHKAGRPKGNSVTYYTVPGAAFNAAPATYGLLAANADHYSFWFVQTPIVIDQLASEVVTPQVSSNFRIGFYAADTDWQPVGAPLADSGSMVSTAAAVKTYTPGTPIYVPRGRYASVLNCDTATVTFRRFNATVPAAGAGYDPALGTTSAFHIGYVTRAFAAFPTPGTAWNTVGLGSSPVAHAVLYRVSQP